MNGREPALTLAPVGVLRGAAWPQASLAWAGAPGELADLAARTPAGSHFEALYDACLATEREALWARTLDDDAFQRALALSSPSALARARRAAGRRGATRNRAMRIVEHTLYRYLARAVGRVTPHGLWAGVTEVAFGDRTRVLPVAPRHRFMPDLRPFQSIVRALADRPAYRHAARWVLNPTLDASADGGWSFLARERDGSLAHRVLGADARIGAALATLAELAPMRLDALAAEVAGSGRWPVGSRRYILKMLVALAEGGVLVGGMDLPAHFATPWEALDTVADSLACGERSEWRATTARLSARCERLSGGLAGLSPDDLLAECTAARGEVARLAGALGVDPGGLPEQVLHCDLHLPWRLVLGPGQQRALLGGLRDYECCWLRAASPAAALRDAQRARLAALAARGVSLGEGVRLLADEVVAPPAAWPASDACEMPQLAQRLRTWEACLRSDGDEVVLRPGDGQAAGATAAVGCLFAGLGERHGLSVRSVSDIATLASARFEGLLDDRGLGAWVLAALQRDARQTGWRLVELHSTLADNPNVAAGPRLLPESVRPWGADPGSLPLLGARFGIGPDGTRTALWLRSAGGGDARPLAVLSAGAAAVQARDPLAQLLLWTGFHESPGRNQRAVDVPNALELARARFTPRVRLPGGALLRHRRTVVQSGLAPLLASRGSHRFAAWLRLARELGWPQRLQVSVDGGEGLRVNRDSPLAVEALFKGIGSHTRLLAVQEAALEPGLEVPGSGSHAVELGIPFARRP